jgi:hypothetical protein
MTGAVTLDRSATGAQDGTVLTLLGPSPVPSDFSWQARGLFLRWQGANDASDHGAAATPAGARRASACYQGWGDLTNGGDATTECELTRVAELDAYAR